MARATERLDALRRTQPPSTRLPPLRAGGRLGEFELRRQIAQGGMGQVWEAVQQPLGRLVALKFIRPDRVDARSIELFEREARAGGRINDGRIVTVHAMGETSGVRWLAQEYVAGERTFGDHLADVRAAATLPPGYYRRTAEFFAEAAEAMAAAHEAGVIHRDLKPGNILIAPDLRPKITDFGLARLIDESSLSRAFSIAGTTHYMSPEQVAGKLLGIDARTDVFSLGAMLYEALTLQRPFDGLSTAEVFSQITLHEPPDPRGVRDEIPADLAVIALKALEKRPEDRFAGMGDLAADLRRHLADEPILAQPSSPLQRALKWSRRHRATSVAAALLVVLVVVVTLFSTQVASKDRQALEHLKQTHVTQSLLYIDNGQLARAAAEVEQLLDLDPIDPRGHLVLAMGYARYLRFNESDAELARAVALGFRPDQVDEGSAESLYLRALYLISRRNDAAKVEAAELLSRAIAMDSDLEHAWFPLYQVRKALDDSEGAALALEAFKDTLHYGDEDIVHVVDALSSELRGEHEQAVRELEALCSEESAQRLVELRAHRHLGRNYLQLFLQQGRDDRHLLDQAESSLQQAVEEVEDDASSWAGLGLVDLLRANASDDGLARDGYLQRAEREARTALELDASASMAQEVLVSVALHRVLDGFDAKTADAALLDELARRLDGLEALDPQSEMGRQARSDLHYLRGAIAYDRGDIPGALELFEQSARTYEQQLRGRVLLAQLLYMVSADYQGALRWLLEAREVWDRGVPAARLSSGTPWEPFWDFSIRVWLLGCGDRAGELDLALEARQSALEWLDAGQPANPEELLTLAEFLATPEHPELADCERALDIVRRFDLEAHFRREGVDGAFPILEAIEASCRR